MASHAWHEIAAYTYKAEIYTPLEIIRQLRSEVATNGDSDATVLARYGNDVEQYLDDKAESAGIDRYSEWSFDSDNFPKVVFRDQLNESE